MYLSKYLAVCGACSRRMATQVIKKGFVLVNGEYETKPKTNSNEGIRWSDNLIKIKLPY